VSGHFIENVWISGEGGEFHSTDPATGERVWVGRAATAGEIDRAVSAARRAAAGWAATPIEERIRYLNAFAAGLRGAQGSLAECICRETGKPRWEGMEEVATMIAKVGVSIEAWRQRRSESGAGEIAGARAVTRFRPHGVLAVFGPFNFPGHLPNGHIVPALLAGNTVVFKPSEMTPGVAQRTVELWQRAGLPGGVLNLVQGGRETGIALANHAGLDGLLFTGSAGGGAALHRAFGGQPQKILALEMGGNNPLIVWDAGDVEAAAYLIVQSAFLTAGQRCTCARRLIVRDGDERLVRSVVELMGKVRVGRWDAEPAAFMGPVISNGAARQILSAQENLVARGGRVIVPVRSIGPREAFLSPGLIDVTEVAGRPDVEVFGPLLQLIRVADFDAAIAEANNTAYGLAAGLISDRRELYERFFREIRAGLVNWNRATTGASGKLPFGGVGLSGNHRPSGYFAADYCSYPVASLEIETVALPAQRLPGLDG
jgi:succinylglutamic semialdehyde dehydrogenase